MYYQLCRPINLASRAHSLYCAGRASVARMKRSGMRDSYRREVCPGFRCAPSGLLPALDFAPLHPGYE
jgi:hypothetical protein